MERPTRSGAGLLFALAACMLLAGGTAHADIGVQATLSPRRAQVGEPLTLSIDVSGTQNLAAPTLGTIEGFDVQYIGPSTEISIVNGRMSASVQHRYSLLPMRPGHFTLGPFSVSYQGKQYQTASFDIDITAAGQPPPTASGAGGAPGGPLRLTLSLPQQQVYLHQRIPVDVTLYIGNVRVADLQYPTLSGTGLSLDKFAEPSQRQQVIDGQSYQAFRFESSAIPLQAGRLAIGPANLQLNVLSRRRSGFFNDPFFNQFFQNDPFAERHPVTVHSDAATLDVSPLPEEGKPADFSGAVGHFTLQVTAAPTTVNAGDPVTVRMALSGDGNLAESGPPAPVSTQGFRVYDAQVSKSPSALRSYEQVLIPNDVGVRAVPAVHFSYFDPQVRRYQTVESQPIALVVHPAPHAAPAVVSGAPQAPAGTAETEHLGRDIVYIKDDPGGLEIPKDAAYRSLPFLLWHPVLLLGLGAAVWYDRRRRRLSGDVRYARFTRAAKEARRGLAQAAQALARGDRPGFYDAVSRTMQQYLAAKLDLPPGGIDTAAIVTRGLSAECVRQVQTLFTTCEQVRFAPLSSDGDMRGTLALAQDVLRQMERTRIAPPPSLPARAVQEDA